MNTKQKIGCATIAILTFIIPLAIFFYFLHRPAPIYETNDIVDYGVIKGNYNNEKPRDFIFSFFPKKIEESFTDVRYHYKAKKLDTYGYEMYLEFVIQDTQTYHAFVADVIGNNASEQFYFDTSYQVCYVSNYLYLQPDTKEVHRDKSKPPEMIVDRSKPPLIGSAKIGAVLFSDTEQRIIFFALGVHDGGGTCTDELDYFFNRFEISPWVYEKKAIRGIAD